MSKRAKPEFGRWIVKMRSTIITEVIVECTEEQAYDDPYKFVVDETVLDCEDWDVLSVKPNK